MGLVEMASPILGVILNQRLNLNPHGNGEGKENHCIKDPLRYSQYPDPVVKKIQRKGLSRSSVYIEQGN